MGCILIALRAAEPRPGLEDSRLESPAVDEGGQFKAQSPPVSLAGGGSQGVEKLSRTESGIRPNYRQIPVIRWFRLNQKIDGASC